MCLSCLKRYNSNISVNFCYIVVKLVVVVTGSGESGSGGVDRAVASV